MTSFRLCYCNDPAIAQIFYPMARNIKHKRKCKQRIWKMCAILRIKTKLESVSSSVRFSFFVCVTAAAIFEIRFFSSIRSVSLMKWSELILKAFLISPLLKAIAVNLQINSTACLLPLWYGKKRNNKSLGQMYLFYRERSPTRKCVAIFQYSDFSFEIDLPFRCAISNLDS